ncbi:arsenate reductase (glutaredoxin) [Psychroserpens sp.]|uniref:arsenate reductase (glutaredoxin) n=1 Tax=Psychroserpens sp. TaxID=2020870 RepID=UPI002B274E44|nr:arsenate reductase (glutaredoxin) [Psychroserpens sp.]
MITIYHNPRCSKSREGLQVLEDSGKNFEIVKYLDEPISEATLKEIINLLGIKPIELVRKNEAIWKSEYKGKDLVDDNIISAMVKHPKLIERPIVVANKKAVIGRPVDNIKSLIE